MKVDSFVNHQFSYSKPVFIGVPKSNLYAVPFSQALSKTDFPITGLKKIPAGKLVPVGSNT